MLVTGFPRTAVAGHHRGTAIEVRPATVVADVAAPTTSTPNGFPRVLVRRDLR